MDILCFMHKSGMSGELTGEVSKLSRMCHASIEQFQRAMEDLKTTKTADVTFCNNSVTVVNRRMKRAYKIRQDTALRVSRYRKKHESNGAETVQISEARSQKSELEVNTEPKGSCDSGESRVNGHKVKIPEIETSKKEYDEIAKTFPEKSTKEIGNDLKTFLQQKKPEFAEPFVDAWNLFADKHGLARVQLITSKRRQKIRIRTREPGFNFFEILTAAGRNKFYMGEEGKWKVDFDHIIENESNYIKILERDEKKF